MGVKRYVDQEQNGPAAAARTRGDRPYSDCNPHGPRLGSPAGAGLPGGLDSVQPSGTGTPGARGASPGVSATQLSHYAYPLAQALHPDDSLAACGAGDSCPRTHRASPEVQSRHRATGQTPRNSGTSPSTLHAQINAGPVSSPPLRGTLPSGHDPLTGVCILF